jgi:hypothetical protein
VLEVAGREIGDAIFIEGGAPQARRLLPVADFSFGLERLVWVVNSGAPYHAFTGPLPEATRPENERAIDRIRTSTLMCLAGVSPSSSGHGRHLRRALSESAAQPAAIDVAIAIAHAHEYWSEFITPVRDVANCRRILESEWDRARAIAVGRHVRADGRLGLAAEPLSADEACRRLLAGGATFEALAAYARTESAPLDLRHQV